MYSKSRVVDGVETHDIITFGALCVEPQWQGCGVGEMLVMETMKIAADAGYKGIKGMFYQSEVIRNHPKEEVEEYNKKFPPLPKLRFPGQWD